MSARPVEVPHAEDMRAFGYVISDGHETIYFSGDSAILPDEVAEGYLAAKSRASTMTPPATNPPRTAVTAVWAERIPREKRAGVHCMHLDGDYAEKLRELGFSVVEPQL